MIVFSGEDGWSTNAAGTKDFLTKVVPASGLPNIEFYIWRSDAQSYTFTATEYVKAHDILFQGEDARQADLERYKAALRYLAVQIDVGANKLEVSSKLKANKDLIESDSKSRNSPIESSMSNSSTKSVVALGTDKSRAVAGVVIEKTVSGRLQCPEEDCELSFKNSRDLKKHICDKCVASGGCVLCPSNKVQVSKMKDRNAFNSHLSAHFDNADQSECPVCHEMVATKKLDKHITTAHKGPKDQKYYCEAHQRGYFELKEWNKHQKESHSSDKVTCEYCSSELLPHSLRTHHKYGCEEAPGYQRLQRVVCPDCGLVTLRRSFPRHYRIHRDHAAISAILAMLEDVEEPLSEAVLAELEENEDEDEV